MSGPEEETGEAYPRNGITGPHIIFKIIVRINYSNFRE